MEPPVKKKEKTTTTRDDSDAGDWLLTELLRRLPLKSLLKFKSVSKRWFSLISDPSMPRLHLPPPDEPPYTLLCRSRGGQLQSIPKLEPFYSFRLGFAPKEETLILAADKGLLLSVDKSCNTYYVSDPLTGQWTGFPFPDPTNDEWWLDCFRNFFDHPRGVGLGDGQPRDVGFVVGPGHQYRVIMIQGFDHDDMNLVSFDSGKGRQWRSSSVQLSHPLVSRNNRLNLGVLYRGALHWVVGSQSSARGKIVAYDPAMHESEGDDYKCRVFEGAPHNLDEWGGLGLSGGKIRYVEIRENSFIRVWVLKDYDSGEWWMTHKIVELEMIMRSLSLNLGRVDECHDIFLWDFNPVDEDVVYFCVKPKYPFAMSSPRSIVSYKISTRTMTILFTCRYENFDCPTISAVPFVLFPCPTLLN